MKSYTVFNKTTGQIMRVEQNLKANVCQGLATNEDMIEADYSAHDLVDPITRQPTNEIITHIDDVLSCINNSDEILNNIISRVPDVLFNNLSVAQWRLSHYALLRNAAYPSVNDQNDALVKMSSFDTTISDEGKTQLAQYYTDCLAVKTRFPKS